MSNVTLLHISKALIKNAVDVSTALKITNKVQSMGSMPKLVSKVKSVSGTTNTKVSNPSKSSVTSSSSSSSSSSSLPSVPSMGNGITNPVSNLLPGGMNAY